MAWDHPQILPQQDSGSSLLQVPAKFCVMASAPKITPGVPRPMSSSQSKTFWGLGLSPEDRALAPPSWNLTKDAVLANAMPQCPRNVSSFDVAALHNRHHHIAPHPPANTARKLAWAVRELTTLSMKPQSKTMTKLHQRAKKPEREAGQAKSCRDSPQEYLQEHHVVLLKNAIYCHPATMKIEGSAHPMMPNVAIALKNPQTYQVRGVATWLHAKLE